MYTSHEQVLQTITEKYDGIDKLSNTHNSSCVYSHLYNKVGCGIGCLLDNELAGKLDTITSDTSIENLYVLYLLYKSKTTELNEKEVRYLDNNDYIGFDGKPTKTSIYNLDIEYEEFKVLEELFANNFDMDKIDIYFLSALQNAHDNSSTVKRFIDLINSQDFYLS